MRKIIFILFILPLFLMSCAEFAQVMETQGTGQPLTQSEVIEGLKEALEVGIKIAAQELSKTDGYYGDNLLRILLPKEAEVITENLNKLPGGKELLNEVILRINRSAENAAREVVPIFTDAITKITIPDAFAILRGESDAATQYLRKSTYQKLFNLYQPRIKGSLDRKLIGNISTNDSWDELTSQWNRIAGSIPGILAGLETVDMKLDEYLTDRALDGLFIKLAEEEGKIRKDPAARVTDILKKVFGSRQASR